MKSSIIRKTLAAVAASESTVHITSESWVHTVGYELLLTLVTQITVAQIEENAAWKHVMGYTIYIKTSVPRTI